MCPEVKISEIKNSNVSASQRKADFRSKEPAIEDRAAKAARYEAILAGLYGKKCMLGQCDNREDPTELPAGIEKEDLVKRGLRFKGTDKRLDGRIVYLFTVEEEKDEKEPGTALTIYQANRNSMLAEIDEKIKCIEKRRAERLEAEKDSI